MAYKKTIWEVRVGYNLNRFDKANETSRSVDLRNRPTSVTSRGTPFSIQNMNKIEQGIYDAHEMIHAETQDRLTADTALNARINDAITALEQEAGERRQADSALQTALEQEAVTRQQADSALQTAIQQEAVTRQQADNALQTELGVCPETSVTVMYRDIGNT